MKFPATKTVRDRYGPWMDTNMVIPTGPDTTTVVYDYFLQKDKIEDLGGDLERYVTESLVDSDKVQQEDNMICESVQRGLSSSAYDTGRSTSHISVSHLTCHILRVQVRSVSGDGGSCLPPNVGLATQK